MLINDIVNKIRFVKQDLRDVKRENPDAELGILPDREPSPASKLVQAKEEHRLIEAMSILSKEDQQVISLRNKEKLTFVEIGKQMDAQKMLPKCIGCEPSNGWPKLSMPERGAEQMNKSVPGPVEKLI